MWQILLFHWQKNNSYQDNYMVKLDNQCYIFKEFSTPLHRFKGFLQIMYNYVKESGKREE